MNGLNGERSIDLGSFPRQFVSTGLPEVVSVLKAAWISDFSSNAMIYGQKNSFQK